MCRGEHDKYWKLPHRLNWTRYMQYFLIKFGAISSKNPHLPATLQPQAVLKPSFLHLVANSLNDFLVKQESVMVPAHHNIWQNPSFCWSATYHHQSASTIPAVVCSSRKESKGSLRLQKATSCEHLKGPCLMRRVSEAVSSSQANMVLECWMKGVGGWSEEGCGA